MIAGENEHKKIIGKKKRFSESINERKNRRNE